MFGYKHDLIKRKTGFLDAFEGIAIRRFFGERAVIDKGGRDRAVPQSITVVRWYSSTEVKKTP